MHFLYFSGRHPLAAENCFAGPHSVSLPAPFVVVLVVAAAAAAAVVLGRY